MLVISLREPQRHNLFACLQRQRLASKLYGLYCTIYGDSIVYAQLASGLILSPTVNEFHFNKPFLSLATNAGVLVGTLLGGFG